MPPTNTATPPAPPPASVPVVGVSKSCPIFGMVTIESKPDEEVSSNSKVIKTKISTIPVVISKCHQVSTTLISLSVSTVLSTSSAMPLTSSTMSTPIAVVPELAIPADAYPEHLNKPCRGRGYLCHLCHFSHSNLDLILTHVRRHLDITVGCPVCSKGYQNVVSLQKHGRDAHNIQIVTSTTSLQGFVDPREEI